MSDQFIIRLHPNTFYLITFNHPLIGKNKMVANKIYADRIDTNRIEILGFTDKVSGDRFNATPANMKVGYIVIAKTKTGITYLGKDLKDHDTLKIKEVYKQK